MEKEILNLRQEDDEDEGEETALRARKSRLVNGRRSTEIPIPNAKVIYENSESTGYGFKSKETSKEDNNFEPTPEDETKKEDFDGITENERLTRSLPQENLVFYDNDEGLWKCRICSWIYQNGSVCVDYVQNHEGELHKITSGRKLENEAKGQVHPTEGATQHITKTQFEVRAGESLQNGKIPSVKGSSVVQGKDMIVTVKRHPVSLSQHGTTTSAEGESPLRARVFEHKRTEERDYSEIEVIKSIIYGGLVETITSLGVVSSAAGGGAATLNILALAVASVTGGFIIICHNLWELRNDCTHPKSEQRDRYRELLGRRENFTLHALISVLSYFIFGLVPPLAYGFSYLKSHNKEATLLMVTAASLLCIAALAVGRAYVRRPPKPYAKSVFTYLILGMLVSGVSYVAGVLVERTLEKLGLLQSPSHPQLMLSFMYE